MQKRRIAAFDIDVPVQNCPFYSFSAYLEHHHSRIYKRFENKGGFLAHAKWVSSQGMLVNVPPYEGIPRKLKETRKNPDFFYNEGQKKTLAWLNKYKIPIFFLAHHYKKDLVFLLFLKM